MAFFAFAASVATPAAADVGPLTATSNAPAVGTPITITSLLNLLSPVTVNASATIPGFSAGNLNPGGAGTGAGSGQMTLQANSAGPTTLTLTYVCAQVGASTITVTHQGATQQTIVINCGGAGAAPTNPTGGSSLVVNPPSGSSATVTGNCTQGQQLTAAGPAYFTGVTLNGSSITAATGSATATCALAGTISASVLCTSQGTVNFSLGNTAGKLDCTTAGPQNCGAQQGVPTNSTIITPNTQPGSQAACPQANIGTSSTASGITITAAPSTVGCSGTSSVTTLTINVAGPNGAMVADKTPVQVTADAGVVSAPSLQTLSGKATTPYTAPSTAPASGSVTIRATAAGATGQTTVALSCAGGAAPGSVGAPPPPVTSSQPALPPPPPAGGANANNVFRPPNTGDAGLKALEAND
jgi:hypothetical protein